MLTSRQPVSSSLTCYTSEQIPYVWDQVAQYIERALDRGSNYTISEIFNGLCAAEMQLWVWQGAEIEAALVTTIQEKAGVKFCLYLALGGSKMNEWRNLMYIVEEWAKDVGCSEMRIYGRIGWAKPFGFDVEYTKMSRKL